MPALPPPAHAEPQPFAAPRLVRDHRAPLFERFGVEVAFENHDQAYKRTYPIKGGKRDSTGVVYIGDGSWGAGPRPLGRDHKEPAWYIEKSASVNHGIIVTLKGCLGLTVDPSLRSG